MEAIRILRKLWRQRLLLAVGFALAIVVATLMTYNVSGFPPSLESRQYVVGVATATALVDSHSSQVADLGGAASRADVASLSVRAKLLANLLATSPLRERIARRAGIAPNALVAISPDDSLKAGTAVAVGSTLDPNDRRASVLNLSVRESVPLMTFAARAPDRATAARLAGGAVEELKEYLGGVATDDRVPDARRLVVEPLGLAHSSTETRGQGRFVAIVIVLALFALWCAAILAFEGFARGWRQAAELESSGSGDSRDVVAEPVAEMPATLDVPGPKGVARLPVRSRSAAPPVALRPTTTDELPELPERPAQRPRGTTA